jgi:transposase
MKSLNNNSFSDSHFYVGVDTHLKNWKVTTRLSGIELKTLSMNPSPDELVKYLRKNYPGGNYHIVYEAGFCGFWAARKLKDLGVDCIIVNPADVPTTNKEKVNKCDPVDSRKLARELENKNLKANYIPNIFQEELRSLMRLRYRIVQSQTRTKNRIKSLVYTRGIKIPDEFNGNSRWSAPFIKWLEKEVKFNTTAGSYCFLNIISQLKEMREQNKNILRQLKEESKKKEIAPVIKALESVPGIGFITAMSLYTEIIDIKRFSNENQMNAFVGLVPSTRSSDETIYGNKITHRQNKYLRPLMIEAAWQAVRKDPAMTAKYKDLTKRMKPQDAIVRIAKKLLRRVRHVWLRREEYAYALVA